MKKENAGLVTNKNMITASSNDPTSLKTRKSMIRMHEKIEV